MIQMEVLCNVGPYFVGICPYMPLSQVPEIFTESWMSLMINEISPSKKHGECILKTRVCPKGHSAQWEYNQLESGESGALGPGG